MSTIFTALIILAFFALAVGKIRKDKKKSPCGSCSYCKGGGCTGKCGTIEKP